MADSVGGGGAAAAAAAPGALPGFDPRDLTAGATFPAPPRIHPGQLMAGGPLNLSTLPPEELKRMYLAGAESSANASLDTNRLKNSTSNFDGTVSALGHAGSGFGLGSNLSLAQSPSIGHQNALGASYESLGSAVSPAFGSTTNYVGPADSVDARQQGQTIFAANSADTIDSSAAIQNAQNPLNPLLSVGPVTAQAQQLQQQRLALQNQLELAYWSGVQLTPVQMESLNRLMSLTSLSSLATQAQQPQAQQQAGGVQPQAQMNSYPHTDSFDRIFSMGSDAVGLASEAVNYVQFIDTEAAKSRFLSEIYYSSAHSPTTVVGLRCHANPASRHLIMLNLSCKGDNRRISVS